MSVCATDCPGTGECVGCRHRQPSVDLAARMTTQEELEQMLAELKGLRLGARELKRSGNPAVKTEGVKALAHIEDQIRWVRGQLEDADA